MTAKDFRQFFSDLFGSRYIARLEEDLLRLRSDFEERLRDKDTMIESLRTEKAALEAKIIVYENTVLPHVSRIGADVAAYGKSQKPLEKPSWALLDIPPMETSWQAEVRKHDAELARLQQEDAAKAT